MENSVKERLEDFLRYKGINNSEFGRRIGVSSAFVSSIRKSIQPDKLQKIALEFPELNIEWLLAGDGVMIKQPSPSVPVVEDTPIKMVLKIPHDAHGGTFDNYIASVQERDCQRVYSPVKDAELAINVTGDSMAPDYPNGCQLFIKKIDEKSFVEWGKVYVLNTCNGTVVKILIPADDNSKVRCMSINPDPRYAPFDVPWEDIYGVYKVLLSMTLQ